MGAGSLSHATNIAVVGMACRLPGGVASPSEFWNVLRAGRDVVGEVGPERWDTRYYHHPDPKEPGTSYTFAAGLLEDITGFDAAFFGISPREAAQMDPHQRLLLELAWEALEDAGQAPRRLAPNACSVHVGISSPDFISGRVEDLSALDAYSMTGGSLSIAANRISYCLDLHGPSMAIDTACSSSLVALHLACEELRRGESSMALVGGVNLLLSPFGFVGFSRAAMLSPTGRCRAFDAAADGYVRAEGGAVLVLKSLGRAKADGDTIHAVLLGTGINSDGRTHGLSLPSGAVQEALLRSVYARAGVDPDRLTFLEAHGTGTAAGDPQEAGAIGRAIATHRASDTPLPIGSVKTNIGHLEAAAGLAGLIKVILAVKHRAIPPSLHYRTPNPDIPFEALNLEVATRYTPLADDGEPLVMGVNSFGFGGANAHAIVAEFPRLPIRRRSPRSGKSVPLLLSARSPAALAETAKLFSDRLAQLAKTELYDFKYTAGVRRAQHDHRLAIPRGDRESILEKLREFHTAGAAAGVVSGRTIGSPARVAFVFSGNGAQWTGMGRRLLEENRVFRAAVGAVDDLLSPLAGFSVVDLFASGSDDARLARTEIAQPALFALQAGLLEVFDAAGLRADVVLGHSVGEIAAAYAAGILDLEQAVRTIHARSAAQAETKGQGRMAAVAAGSSEVAPELQELDGAVELAAVNSPRSVTLSGSLDGLRELKGRFETRGTFYRILDLDYAFHSRVMDAVRDPLLSALSDLRPSRARIPFVSTITGGIVDGETLDAGYWWENVRQPVRLDLAIESVASDGACLYLETGPHPILQSYIQENLGAVGAQGRALPTLRKDDDGQRRVEEAIFGCHVMGARLDRGKVFPVRGRCVSLPSYPWQRERHWYSSTDERIHITRPRFAHPLLGFEVPGTEHTWENRLDTLRFPYLADHAVGGAVVFPASAFVEMALAAANEISSADRHVVENFAIRAPLVLTGDGSKVVRFTFDAEDHSFKIRSRPRFAGEDWTLHVTGRLGGAQARREPESIDLSERKHMSCLDSEQLYAAAAGVGLSYGPAFRAVEQVRLEEHKAYTELAVPEAIEGKLHDYHLHPVMLDACLHGVVGFLAGRNGPATCAYLPQRLDRCVIQGDGSTVRYCRTDLRRVTAGSLVADFTLTDAYGSVVARLEGLRFRRMPHAGRREPSLIEFRAVPKPLGDGDPAAPIPRPETMARAARSAMEAQWRGRRRNAYYEQVLPLLDALVSAHGLEALRDLGVGEASLTLEAFTEAAGIPAARAGLLRRLLGMLQEDGIAEHRDGGWAFRDDAELPGAQSIWRRILADFPDYLPELTVAGGSGLHLAAVLRGETEPGELLVPARSDGAAAQLFTSSLTARVLRESLYAALQAMYRSWPPGRRVRVLELPGAGAVLAPELLLLLPQSNCDYVLAAPDEATRRRLTAELAGVPWASAAIVDLAGEPAEQDLAPCAFDVVIAPYALHAPADRSRVLANVRRLLASDGLFVLMERGRDRLADLVFGVEPGWWQWEEGTGEAAGRAFPPLSAWPAILEESGLVDVESVTEVDGLGSAGGALFVARNPRRRAPALDLATDAPRRVVLVADDSGDSREIALRMAESLRTLGHDVVDVRIGAGFERISAREYVLDIGTGDGFDDLCAALAREERLPTDVFHLAGLSLQSDLPDIDLMAVQERRCACTLELVQSLAGAGWPQAPRLWLVTCGAVAPECVKLEPLRHVPSQAPLWGLGRVLMNEHPELGCRLLDLHIAHDPIVAAGLLVRELRESDGEDEVLLNADRRYVMRAWPVDAADFAIDDRASPEKPALPPPVRLEASATGLDRLRWRQIEPEAPGAGEIAVRVRATGLNFRDVMIAMGMLTDEALENGLVGAGLGMECAGEVIAVGPDVTEFAPGDPVVCFAPSSFSSQVITTASAAVHKPAAWSYAEGAGVPVAFLTAYYALHHLGTLQAEDRILIHGAAGGVGIAAIQYARHRGATIFATAGSEEKRDFLRMLGVKHVLDSRSLEFAEEIAAITKGEGVDVVLNSLSGEAITKNLEVLRPFGRFLELGKRDYYENTRIGLRPFRNNISYFGIDVDQLFKEHPDLSGRLLREVMDLFVAGAFRPIPHRIYSSEHLIDAFRHMQQSRHIGKIVVDYDRVPAGAPVTELPAPEISIAADATYLITGGLGGIGLATARWLMEKGARNLVLMGRRGLSSDVSRAAVAALREGGANVQALEADVTNGDALREILDDLEATMPPLRGIVHAAMVVDDGLIRGMDRAQLSRVLAPKLLGAWNLHRLTLGKALEFFVLYSSATTCIGNPGQSSYVAANMFLEALATYRRASGLPAMAVSWGPVVDVGYLAENEAIRDALVSRVGGPGLTSEDLFRVLERLMAANRSSVAVADLDWRKLTQLLPALRSSKFEIFTRKLSADDSEERQAAQIHELLQGMSPEEAEHKVAEMLRGQVAEVLRLPPEQVEVDRSIFELGMDSLMAVELQVAIEARFAVKIPAMAMSDNATIAGLAARIARRLRAGEEVEAHQRSQSDREMLAALGARHGQALSDQELAVLTEEGADTERGAS